MNTKARPQEVETWKHVQSLEEFSASDLSALGVPIETARGYINRWERDRKICLVRQGGNRQLYFAPVQRVMTRDGAKPIAKTPENNMWTAMRGLKQFSAQDVSIYATNGGVEVSLDMAQAYIDQLLSAGYLKSLIKSPKMAKRLYRLLKNTGPFGPSVHRARVFADPNTQNLRVMEEASIWQRF